MGSGKSNGAHNPIDDVIASTHDNAGRMSKAVLGCILEEPPLLEQADLSTEQFFPSANQEIWQAIARLRENGTSIDVVTLAAELDGKVDAAYLASLIEGCVPENFRNYVRRLRETSEDRRFLAILERLPFAKRDERLPLLDELRNLLEGSHSSDDWRSLFHSWGEIENTAPLQFAIDGFLQEGGITFVAGLPGHAKTLVMLAMTRALLDGEPLFGYFAVPQRASRICYLIPESTIGPFWARIKLFHLEDYVRDDRLLIHTLSSREQVSLTDPRILKAAANSHLVWIPP